MTVPPEVEELIEGERLIAHVATSVDDRPHGIPIWYRYDDGVIYVTSDGKAVRNLAANPRVSVSVQDDVDGYPEWVVSFKGTADLIREDDAIERLCTRIFSKYMGPDPEDWGEEYRAIVADPGPDRAVVAIEPRSVSRRVF